MLAFFSRSWLLGEGSGPAYVVLLTLYLTVQRLLLQAASARQAALRTRGRESIRLYVREQGLP